VKYMLALNLQMLLNAKVPIVRIVIMLKKRPSICDICIVLLHFLDVYVTIKRLESKLVAEPASDRGQIMIEAGCPTVNVANLCCSSPEHLHTDPFSEY